MSQSWLDKISAEHGISTVEEEEEETQDSSIQNLKNQNDQFNEGLSPDNNANTDISSPEPSKNVVKVSDENEEVQNSSHVFHGSASEQMTSYKRANADILKRQEKAYVDTLIETRQKINQSQEKTSAPLQNSGGLGQMSLEAKMKYEQLVQLVFSIKPQFVAKPKKVSTSPECC